jgi:hypothetical protein
VLRNPKYTGYQVWNRRARKKGHNRTNPPEAWVWSDEPAHPAIVSREEHEAVQARAAANHRSRLAMSATEARASARTNYLYRGLLRCGICGLRMWGNHRRRSTYYYSCYSCQPSHQRSKDIPAGHPAHVYLNEQRLDDALLPFLATALFGPDRTEYWRRCLDAADEPEQSAPAAERAKEVEAEIADLERRLNRQTLNLEADDVTPALRRRIAGRVAELEEAMGDRQDRLAALAAQAATEAPTLADVAPLLDACPSSRSSSRTRSRANYGRCSTSSSSTSPTSRPSTPLTSHSPSMIPSRTTAPPPHVKVRRTGRCPRQELNLRTWLRRPMLYPLSYEGNGRGWYQAGWPMQPHHRTTNCSRLSQFAPRSLRSLSSKDVSSLQHAHS